MSDVRQGEKVPLLFFICNYYIRKRLQNQIYSFREMVIAENRFPVNKSGESIHFGLPAVIIDTTANRYYDSWEGIRKDEQMIRKEPKGMRKNGLKCLAFLTAVILLIGSACTAEGLTETDDNFFVSTDPLYEKLTERVKKTSHSNSYKGSILLATDDGIILYGGPGSLTTDGQPTDMHTTYDIGSCSKLFTAVAVFQMIEAGMMSLEDPLGKYFPEYETGRDITVYQLLHMQSGIPDYTNEPDIFWGDTFAQDPDLLIRRFFSDDISDEEFLQNLYAAPLVFTPGTEQRYSNTNYHLLAMMVEQVSGMKLDAYMEEHIFRPCGMEHTTAMRSAEDLTSVPKMFMELLNDGLVDENGYTMQPVSERGAGGIHTCVTDLWVFDKALLSGQLVSSESLEEITHFDMDYGCGMCPFGKNGIGHSGRNGTYTTLNIIVESKQYGRIYFIASTPTDAGTYGLGILENLIGNI